MKIALAHYSATSDISGVTTWLIDFIHRLSASGHTLALHLHHFGPDPQEASILKSLQGLPIEVHAVCRSGSLERDSQLTLAFLNRVRPQLFLPQCLHAHYLAAAHAGRQGLPWVFTMHSDDSDYWCVAEALTPEAHGGRSVCVSQFLAQQLLDRLPITQPAVIPCGIAIPEGHANFAADPFRVVFSGRLVSRQKCIYQVIAALIGACRLSPRIEAALLGDGPERAACEQQSQAAGLADRIRFLGRLAPAEVPPLLLRSQAIVLMSDFEGLPVALLEAMAAGVVPVVRDIASGIPELVHHEHTGLLVANDSAEAASALLRLSQDPGLWQHCSEQARSLVQSSYSAEACFRRWRELVKQHSPVSQVHFPLSTTDLRRSLPFNDPRFQSQYSSRPSRWSRLHPRRMLGCLRRFYTRIKTA